MSGISPETQKKMDEYMKKIISELPTMTAEQYLIYNRLKNYQPPTCKSIKRRVLEDYCLDCGKPIEVINE